MESRKQKVWKKALQATKNRSTPILVMDTSVMRDDWDSFRSNFPTAGIFFALKANSDPAVARFFLQLGAGFEVGSEGALKLLLDIGVDPAKTISGNPLKTPDFLRHAYAVGIRRYTFDSAEEVTKMAQLAPEAEVYVRIAVSNNFSEWPLDKKFGIEDERAADLLIMARDAGLIPRGIAFHPGSQCISTEGWTKGLAQCKRVWDDATARGLQLTSLNLGGGFPSEYTRPVPPLQDIASAVYQELGRLFPAKTELLLEPGRGLVGEAGVMVTTVIAKAIREDQQWIYLDAGVFNGLMESIGGITYPMWVTVTGRKKKYTVAGPSCDSMDVLPGKAELPELSIGDRVYIMSAGAYTTAYASRFDGIPVPKVLLI